MEAYRVFSENICSELGDPTAGAIPPAAAARTGFEPDKAGEKQHQILDSKSSGVVEVRPRVTERRRSVAERATARERADVERDGHDDCSSGGATTFLTALKRTECTDDEGATNGLRAADALGSRKDPGWIKDLRWSAKNQDGRIADGANRQGEGGGGFHDYDKYNSRGNKKGSNNSPPGQTGKRKIDIILSAASREFVSSGVGGVDTVARPERGHRGRTRRTPSMDCLDAIRSTLMSAR